MAAGFYAQNIIQNNSNMTGGFGKKPEQNQERSLVVQAVCLTTFMKAVSLKDKNEFFDSAAV